MRLRTVVAAGSGLLILIGLAYAVEAPPKPWRQYQGREYSSFAIPPDYAEKTEWQFARLMYPSGGRRGGGRFGFRGGGDWREGGGSWTTDYPRADRHMAPALKRLTRVHVRSVEQAINPDDPEDIFNYPWLYAVEVGQWDLTDDQAKKIREYLDRGGFLMVDDFHGTYEWANFMVSMLKIYPDRPVVDIPDSDPIFHTIYDLSKRYQVPGAMYLRRGVTYENDGYEARWRGIYDEHNRLAVAICHNMDLGDSWEWADDPAYDEKFSSLSFRIAANYVIYSMTH
ncbi:MAG: hypothetical protein JWN34_3549 [Bryobacterales bacterium]|nr:hypothetical protein [Bryobacterales bacterium]